MRGSLSSWLQTLGMYHSFQKSKQLGPVTRLLSCTEEQLKQYKDVDGVPTHIAPSWTIHPISGDQYRCVNAFSRPASAHVNRQCSPVTTMQ